MKLNIRTATSDDAEDLCVLIHENTEQVAENNYTATQIAVWKKQNSSEAIVASLQHKTILCAFAENRLVGTVALQDNFVTGLYINFRDRGKGIGYQLLQFLEEYAKTKGIKTLELTSTPNGYGFYLKNGYEVVGEVELTYDGVTFVEPKMMKHLID